MERSNETILGLSSRSEIKMKNTKDKNIREELHKTLYEALVSELKKSKKSASHPARILPELGVSHGDCRIDLVTVNGILHGYEIKSDADTLDRLNKQAAAYNPVFDQITLVVGETHILQALEMIPGWWGVKLASGKSDGTVHLTDIREALPNPQQDSLAIARLLWRQEVIEILSNMHEDRGTKSKCREDLYAKLIDVLDKPHLMGEVRKKLFYRQGWRSDAPLLRCGD